MTISTENIRIEQSDISDVLSLFLQNISVEKTDNQQVMLKKMDAISSLSKFVIQNIKIDTLSTQEAKHKYIRFLSKLNEMHEALEILTGQVSIEEIEAAGKSFARKTQFAIGIYD